jgi:formiminotetrahydrofolate cyclodeaminase
MLPRYWRAKSKRGKDAGSLDSHSYRGDRGRRIAPLCSRQKRGGHLLKGHLCFLHSTTVLRDANVTELLAAIGERTPAPASGAATALTAALAAALAELAARYAGNDDDAERAHRLAAELVRLGDADAAAYSAFMANRNEQTRAEIVRIPEEIARLAEQAVATALRAAGKLSPSVAGDARAAAELGRAAAAVARGLAELNRAGS